MYACTDLRKDNTCPLDCPPSAIAVAAMPEGPLIMVMLISVQRNGALVTAIIMPPVKIDVGGGEVSADNRRGATTTTNFIE